MCRYLPMHVGVGLLRTPGQHVGLLYFCGSGKQGNGEVTGRCHRRAGRVGGGQRRSWYRPQIAQQSRPLQRSHLVSPGSCQASPHFKLLRCENQERRAGAGTQAPVHLRRGEPSWQEELASSQSAAGGGRASGGKVTGRPTGRPHQL